MSKAFFDTNLLVDWMNAGRHEELLLLRPGVTRYLSAIVALELRAGATTTSGRAKVDSVITAYRRVRRLVAPTAPVCEQAGEVLRRLRGQGVEIRHASLVNDVLIALSARSIGATVFTRDSDFLVLQREVAFSLEILAD